jgi:uncharacterized iron-regulated membrane protein
MKGIQLNKLHRYAGITIAPFLVLQTFTGLLLDFGLFRRGVSALAGGDPPVTSTPWDAAFIKAHFGQGAIGDCYHLLLGAGIVWMAFSGWILYLRGRRLRKKAEIKNTVGKQ